MMRDCFGAVVLIGVSAICWSEAASKSGWHSALLGALAAALTLMSFFGTVAIAGHFIEKARRRRAA